jgi:hypothetical protein
MVFITLTNPGSQVIYLLSVRKSTGSFTCIFTLIPTLESSSIAHVERHWCLLSKLLATCKVVLPIQSNQLDTVVWTKLFAKIITVKFETTLFTEEINWTILGDMTRPMVNLNVPYSDVCYNRVLLYYVMSVFSIENVTLKISPPNGKAYLVNIYVWHIVALRKICSWKCLCCEILPCYKCILQIFFHSTFVK